tara:strand:+ start:789 stop:908 length:120 start_codon:yes stop_codon:yes gene_type:complete
MNTKDRIIAAKKRINELEILIKYWSMKKTIEKQRQYQII